ncbi:MAG: hypothetical protein ACI9O6_000316 [Glaciecola sp.]|jgi:hypothetical protein
MVYRVIKRMFCRLIYRLLYRAICCVTCCVLLRDLLHHLLVYIGGKLMKVKIELDLSPAEAREIFGLPDFSQLHSSITEDLAEKCAQDPQKAFETFIKPSMENNLSGFSAYQKMMEAFMKGQSKSD